jgi:NAD(P)-dependent dehydrogenase (short-subunit alcohol dehydrogenase family)
MKRVGNVVLVTGVSRGLGTELGVTLTRAGYRVIGVDRSPCPSRLRRKGFEFIQTDITNPKQVGRLKKIVEGKYETVDVLINNAGRLIPHWLGKSSLDDWNKVIALNLTAPFMLVNAFVLGMNEFAKDPLVINISSISGFLGGPFCSSYICSKHGLIGLTEAINEEFRIHGRTRSVAVCPGPIDTPAQQDLGNVPGISLKPGENMIDPAKLAELILMSIRFRSNLTVTRIVVRPR